MHKAKKRWNHLYLYGIMFSLNIYKILALPLRGGGPAKPVGEVVAETM